MSNKTPIEWTEQTWNPTTGCTKISTGCKHCYAEKMALRLHCMGATGYENKFELTLHAYRLDQPLRRKKPTVYFVNSMSDLFHEHVPFAFIDQVMAVMKQTPQHTYQILTKRAARMRKYFSKRIPPGNAWLGVSVENKKHGLSRIDQLRDIPASIRFLSVEPLLEDLGKVNLDNIHWVIVGGESGPKARPMQPEWVANIKRQCELVHVSFFFKQWGGWGADGVRRHKALNGRLFEGRTWDDRPLIEAPYVI